MGFFLYKSTLKEAFFDFVPKDKINTLNEYIENLDYNPIIETNTDFIVIIGHLCAEFKISLQDSILLRDRIIQLLPILKSPLPYGTAQRNIGFFWD